MMFAWVFAGCFVVPAAHAAAGRHKKPISGGARRADQRPGSYSVGRSHAQAVSALQLDVVHL